MNKIHADLNKATNRFDRLNIKLRYKEELLISLKDILKINQDHLRAQLIPPQSSDIHIRSSKCRIKEIFKQIKRCKIKINSLRQKIRSEIRREK